MARFDVFELSGSRLVLDVQSDFLFGIATRLVVPLLPEATAPRPFPRLNPKFGIDGKDYVMATTLVVAVPVQVLTTKVASLRAEQDQISRALDMVLFGA